MYVTLTGSTVDGNVHDERRGVEGVIVYSTADRGDYRERGTAVVGYINERDVATLLRYIAKTIGPAHTLRALLCAVFFRAPGRTAELPLFAEKEDAP